MIPGSKDITLYQGDKFTFTFRLKDSGTGQYIDLTGYTPSAQIRSKESATSPYASFTCTLLDQTSVKGGVKLFLGSSATAAVPAGTWVWDVQLANASDATDVQTYLKGKATVIAEVTR